MATAILVTFASAAEPAELAAIAVEFAGALTDVDGLLGKTWLETHGGSGGFYIFRDDAAADAYLSGPLVAELQQHPKFSAFLIQRFGVDEALSARTHGLPSP
ncbi:YdhR family protein [Mycobacterium sp. UM_Kg1]|uniref:YdhR family protein n=1 Tax=Mycobacterium sp. UM_Kg1 TaxID=1545691 RepID=UPI00061ACD74|nr:YdhR family protein [Mycobacterium sp. UM_Kg1]